MKMGSKMVLTLLVVAFVLPAAGFAEEKAADAAKPATVLAKPAIAAPADCVLTGKTKAITAKAKRQKIHADKGIVSGEGKLVVHDHQAAHEHGRHGEN
jgi:hypothetical protein